MPRTVPNYAAIALNFQPSDIPEWVQLLPAGPEIVGRDGRRWTLPKPDRLVAAFAAHGMDLPVDIEHATELRASEGEEAPAVGWIEQLEVREDGIWGKVTWTDAGAWRVGEKNYRYLSPVFVYDKGTSEILALISVALTNQPNLKLAALNQRGRAQLTNQEIPMKELMKALGLAEAATEAEALTALNALKEDRAKALNRAQSPDPDKYVPKADHDLALNRIGEFETSEKERAEAEVGAAVDAAVEAGKIAPASRDHYLAMCRQDGGLETFGKLVETMPVIAGGQTAARKADPAKGVALNTEEKAVAKALGMSEADFAAAKAEETSA